MKTIMKTSIYLPMAAMFLAAALAGPALAENQVPFKGSLEGVVSITPIDAQFSFVRINGTGNATHLGLFTVDIPHIVNRQARIGIGTLFTAANGDTLTATLPDKPLQRRSHRSFHRGNRVPSRGVRAGSPTPLGASSSRARSTLSPA